MHQHALHQLVARRTRQRVRPLADRADYVSLAHDRRGAGAALGLVGAQRCGQVGRAAQVPRQPDGVFSLIGALPRKTKRKT